MGRRNFSIDEVNQLIPQLEYHFKKILVHKKEIAKISLRLKKIGIVPKLIEEDWEDPRPEVQELHTQLQQHYQAFKKHVLAIEGLGGEIKDFELGRVVFSSTVEGQEAHLIWQLGVTGEVHCEKGHLHCLASSSAFGGGGPGRG